MKKIFIIIAVFFLICTVFFLGLFFYEQNLIKQENELNEQLIDEFVITDTKKEETSTDTNTDGTTSSNTTEETTPPTTEKPKPTYTAPKYTTPTDIDFASLKKKNSDVGGWVCLENSYINYPILMSEGNYYLRRNIYKQNANQGCIFAYNNQKFETKEELDKNVILYGHNMKNGTMFTYLNTLLNNPNYLKTEKNKFIFLYTEHQIYKYEIYSVYKTEKTSNFNQVYFKDDNDFLSFCNTTNEKSVYKKSGINFDADGHVLTLATCANSNSQKYRTVLHAVLVETIEK